jgi:predicted ABC-type ATPase
VARPELGIVAGPNGAGKTTLVQAQPIRRLLPHVTFFNPDDEALILLTRQGYHGFSDAPESVRRTAFLTAAEAVASLLNAALARGEAVGVETVLSSDKYRPVVDAVRAQHGFVGLIYVTLASPELACARVSRRVRAGGHDVPTDKIHSRWRRSLANLGGFAANASAFWVFDNSDENPAHPPLLVAEGGAGILTHLDTRANKTLLDALSMLPRGKKS